MNKVVSILMERDELTTEEASSAVKEARQAMEDCGFEPEECEEIMLEDLGLEMDYIIDVLDFES